MEHLRISCIDIYQIIPRDPHLEDFSKVKATEYLHEILR